MPKPPSSWAPRATPSPHGADELYTDAMGRIGQEVFLDFIEGDIERPIVIGSLYNGRGEAGLPPTPGGASAEADTSAYAQSHDHAPSAQGNLIGSGSITSEVEWRWKKLAH